MCFTAELGLCNVRAREAFTSRPAATAGDRGATAAGEGAGFPLTMAASPPEAGFLPLAASIPEAGGEDAWNMGGATAAGDEALGRGAAWLIKTSHKVQRAMRDGELKA